MKSKSQTKREAIQKKPAPKKATVKKDVLATVTIFNAAKLHPETKQNISKWLRRIGTQLLKEADKYADKFTSKYHAE